MIQQPTLYVPPEIELGLLDGTLKLFGSVVREADTGRIFKHLNDVVPSPEKVEEAVKSLRLSPKIVISVIAVTTIAGAGVTYLIKKRSKTDNKTDDKTDRVLVAVEDLPACLTEFEASLHAYIDAGRAGALDADVVERLIADLDAVKAFAEEGNEVRISLDDLVPLFDMVIAHTSRLAEAYDVPFETPDADSDSEDGVVISLRHHLEAQKTILAEVS